MSTTKTESIRVPNTAAEWMEKVTAGLMRPFHEDEVKQLAARGNPTYIEGNTCIDRLNEVFGPLGWGFEPQHIEWQPVVDGSASRKLAVYGVLTVYLPTHNVVKAQWGAATVKDTNEGNKQDFGDDVKAAATDALKKCATLLGIYNYGYRKAANANTLGSLATDLSAAFTAKGWSPDEFKEWAGGIVGKTILGVGDLSPAQARLLLKRMASLPE
jgi:hypothetical protein